MSLGDYLRLLRAQKGGVTPMEIEAVTGLTPGLYRYMEQRYRAVGDDDSIQTLADYYEVPFADLIWRLDWPRKGLSRALAAVVKAKAPITLYLWNGQSKTGRVIWWDLGAIELEDEQGATQIVQRHAVERWDPRAPDPPAEEQDEPDDEE